MAAVTLLGTPTCNTANGTKTVTATPAVGDLIVLVTAHTGNTSSTAPTDDNNSGTYTQLETAVKNSSADTLKIWVRDALIASASSTVFTHAPGTTTGGALAVLKVTGMTRVGAGAERQSAKEDNQAAATPTPVLGAAALTGNALIGAVFNATNPAGMTARSSPAYTERRDDGYASPTSGIEIMSIDSGETATSIAWGSASASAFCSAIVELDTTVPNGQPAAGAMTLTGQAPTVILGTLRQPGAGAQTMTGQAPSALRGSVMQPGAGAMALAGNAPTVASGAVMQPGAGAMVIGGNAPSLLLNVIVQPDAVELALGRRTPTVKLGTVVEPGAAAITAAGAAPIVVRGAIVEPAAGALTLTGISPSLGSTVVAMPGVGALAFSGLAPSITVGSWPLRTLAAGSMGYLRPRRIVAFDPATTTQPEPGLLTLSGLEPAVLVGAAKEPAAAAMTLAGQAPTLIRGTILTPAAGALALTGLAPSALVSDTHIAAPDAGALALTGYAPAIVSSSPDVSPDACALAIFGAEPTIVVSGDGILSAKYLGGARKNVPFKPARKKKDEPEPKKATKVVKPSPLLLGLLARGLALPEEIAPVVIEAPAPVEFAPPISAPAPLPTPEELLQARVDSLEQQMQAMRAEIAALRAPPVAAPATARDPVFEAMHAILPAIGRPIDLDAPPPDDDEPTPDEPVEIGPPPPAPAPRPKMTREEIERENERRAAMAAELLL